MRGHVAVLTITLVAACSTPSEVCEPLSTDCAPEYEPTFDNIHSRTVTPGCAISGASCHATADSSGGFSLAQIEDAYSALSRRGEDSDCGVLASRITSDNASRQMPPGMPLSEGEQCAILQWIEAGTPR